ncbi:MAG: hypothetical protein Ct9H300mP29_6790 [Candidatus Neomarinimicrobiota bacterium]|nr:MAG: hypothetical protein Ct9H300mP29_6790 [Candidatus Neomarinimicrobiota bacterium]
MVSLYLLAGIFIIITNLAYIPDLLILIFSDAFSGKAAAGGVIGSVIITGVRRASFSNEAGLGTEAMAHGAAKTSEPVREGLVAMLGAFYRYYCGLFYHRDCHFIIRFMAGG